MERTRSGISGVRPDDLVEVVTGAGPFATVWLATPLAVGHDPLIPALATAGDALSAAGAPEAVVGRLTAAVQEQRHAGLSVLVLADGRGGVLAEPFPDPPRAEITRWAVLPSVVPVLEHRQAQIPYVVALLDRTGADLFAGAPDDDPDATAGGRDGPISKSAPGGWSQRRYQQRAENTWEHNAGDVATELVRLVEQIDARLVLVGGDVRARQLLDAALPPAVGDLVRGIPGGRARDGSEDARETEIERLVHTAVASDTVDLLRAYREESGQDRAVDGAAATIDALRRGQVDVLLVHDDIADEASAWIGPQPEHIALDRAALETMGVADPVEARRVDAMVRAALGTGASVRVVPAAAVPVDAVGAILRW